MDKVLEFVKQNVKVVLTVTVLGLGVTAGWANGCTVGLTQTTPAPAQVAAPAAP